MGSAPPLPNTPGFGWAVGQTLPGAHRALESFWPSPSSGRGFGFLVGTGQVQVPGRWPPPPSTWGPEPAPAPENRDPARGGAVAPAFPRARSPQLHRNRGQAGTDQGHAEPSSPRLPPLSLRSGRRNAARPAQPAGNRQHQFHPSAAQEPPLAPAETGAAEPWFAGSRCLLPH